MNTKAKIIVPILFVFSVGFASVWSVATADGPTPVGGGDGGEKFRCVEYEWVDDLPEGDQGGCGDHGVVFAE